MNPLQDRSDEEIRSLVEAASPGPWNAETSTYGSEFGPYEGGTIPGVAEEIATESDGYVPPLSAANTRFIAAARDLVPSLLARAVAAEAALAAIQGPPCEHEFGMWSSSSIFTIGRSCKKCDYRQTIPNDDPVLLAEHFSVPVYPTPTGEETK